MKIYHLSTGKLVATQSLSQSDVAEIWGRASIRRGSTIEAPFFFWSTEPFRATARFDYQVSPNDGTGHAEYDLQCEPPFPPPTGIYVLRSISGRSLPTQGTSWITVHSSAITFSPNLSYVATGRTNWVSRPDEVRDHTVGPRPFTVVSRDSIDVPSILTGYSAGRMAVSGNVVTYTVTGAFDDGPYVWRFEKMTEATRRQAAARVGPGKHRSN